MKLKYKIICRVHNCHEPSIQGSGNAFCSKSIIFVSCFEQTKIPTGINFVLYPSAVGCGAGENMYRLVCTARNSSNANSNWSLKFFILSAFAFISINYNKVRAYKFSWWRVACNVSHERQLSCLFKRRLRRANRMLLLAFWTTSGSCIRTTHRNNMNRERFCNEHMQRETIFQNVEHQLKQKDLIFLSILFPINIIQSLTASCNHYTLLSSKGNICEQRRRLWRQSSASCGKILNEKSKRTRKPQTNFIDEYIVLFGFYI